MRSHFTSTTRIPSRFHIDHAIALTVALPDTFLNAPELPPEYLPFFKDSLEFFRTNREAWDKFLFANQLTMFGILGKSRIPFTESDTLVLLNPPIDLNAHAVIPDYSEDVGGVLSTIRYEDDVSKGGSSFDNFFGGNPDSSDKWEEGNAHRLSYDPNIIIPGTGKSIIDTLFVSNAFLYVGESRFYFYATDSNYWNYINNVVQGATDSRIRPTSNIQGAQGVFVGMVVDSLIVQTRALPGSTVWPYERTSVLSCRERDWTNPYTSLDGKGECRMRLESFCKDSLSVSPDCRPFAVAAALDSGLAWDARMLPLDSATSADTVRARGERLFCRNQDYPDNALCDLPREECLESPVANRCKKELWNWCLDRGWPMETIQACGSGLVSWMRLEKKSSVALVNARNRWCASHTSDAQCKF